MNVLSRAIASLSDSSANATSNEGVHNKESVPKEVVTQNDEISKGAVTLDEDFYSIGQNVLKDRLAEAKKQYETVIKGQGTLIEGQGTIIKGQETISEKLDELPAQVAAALLESPAGKCYIRGMMKENHHNGKRSSVRPRVPPSAAKAKNLRQTEREITSKETHIDRVQLKKVKHVLLSPEQFCTNTFFRR